MTRLVQIVPNLPPSVNGVGDYALLLAGALRAHGVETSFLVANAAWNGAEVQGFQTARLEDGQAVLENGVAAVLLQYVGYGYSKRGAPLWLVRWMRALARRPQKPVCAVFFHELYAVGPPWRSSFWFSLVQRHVCRQLARLADVRLTNRSYSAAILDEMSAGDGKTTVLPVVSNFGEPATVPQLAERKPQLAVYGGLRRTAQEGDRAAPALRAFCAAAGIERVVSFGKTAFEAFSPDIPVENRGVLSAQEVSTLLLESRACYQDYPLSNLGKSGIYAACCAHGTLPLVLEADAGQADGIRRDENVHVVTSPGDKTSPEHWQSIADAAFRWYQGHSLPRIAEIISHAILNPAAPRPV
ncbi:MAG: hypothetical protein JNG86_09600 [Verrucomicrobiaceae bacterium]|nr:hypothetical protein [Verrucomicrobiaceae bacterium]